MHALAGPRPEPRLRLDRRFRAGRPLLLALPGVEDRGRPRRLLEFPFVLRLVVLSDTHIGPRSRRRLPDSAYEHLAEADVILHAGDVLIADFLDELRGFAPTHAVLGNNDHELVGVLPETLVLGLEGLEVGMVHDSGPATGRAGRMRRRFPSADLVVFGHSHIPWNEVGLADQILFNPGSPTDRRSQPAHTLGRVDLDGGRIVSRRICAV